MIRGLIYAYISPNGKYYIGQTVHESLRRKLWKSSTYHYAGKKIDRARAKYGREAFTYQVLFEKKFASKEIAVFWLNIVEMYYIQYYDSVKNGYNATSGGRANYADTAAHSHKRGYKLSEEVKKNISAGVRKWQHTPEGRLKISLAHKKAAPKRRGYKLPTKQVAVVQMSMDGTFVAEYPSVTDAGASTQRANITAVCLGRRNTAGGYRWLYAADYYDYFLFPERSGAPQGVQRMLNAVNTYKIAQLPPPPKGRKPRIYTNTKAVGQYDLSYNLIKVWKSGSEAGKQLGFVGSNIHRAIRTLGTYMGFYWRYYNEEQVCSPKPKKKITHPKAYKSVIQMDLNGNFIATHESVTAACKAIGVNHTAVLSMCLNEKCLTAYGYIWKFNKCA